jgi:hypothetical protein
LPAAGEYLRVDFFLPVVLLFAVFVAISTPSWL